MERIYSATYLSPLGKIYLTCCKEGITGLSFKRKGSESEGHGESVPVMEKAFRWLDLYFEGKEPDFEVPLKFNGTPFQQKVYETLLRIPYGETVTYSDIAAKIYDNPTGMCYRAVGRAVSSNRILIFIPCHRVIMKDGSLGGFAEGVDLKRKLMRNENIMI